jgi:hypothetical protein
LLMPAGRDLADATACLLMSWTTPSSSHLQEPQQVLSQSACGERVGGSCFKLT